MSNQETGATPGVIEQLFRFVEARGSIVSMVGLTTSAITLEKLSGVKWTTFGIAAGVLGVLAGIFAEWRRDDLRSELMKKEQDLDECTEVQAKESVAAQTAIAELDGVMGSALETIAKGLFADMNLCGGDRITIYGLSEVGNENQLIRLARYSRNATISDAGREVCEITGYLEKIWSDQEINVVMPPIRHKKKYRKAHVDAGLTDDNVFDNLTFKPQSYFGRRIENAHDDPIGIVIVEGCEESCPDEHQVQPLPMSAMMSVVPLIMATTKRYGNGGEAK